MRIAVVGTGPAGAATLLGLGERLHGARLTVFDIGTRVDSSLFVGTHPDGWSVAALGSVHKRVARSVSGMVPEKSLFGYVPPRYPGTAVYKSHLFGGLSKLWGAGLLPFTESDLRSWPVTVSDLRPCYMALSAEIPITGGVDKANEYFAPEYTNQEPIRITSMLEGLIAQVNAKDDLIAGRSRLAVRTTGANSCTGCDHCFYGCYRQSIYSADETVERMLAKTGAQYCGGLTVKTYRRVRDGRVEIAAADGAGRVTKGLFDRVFLAAGCIESTRIVASSEGMQGKPFAILENPVFAVPVIYTRARRGEQVSSAISLSNVFLGAFHGGSYVHSQMYHVNPYMIRHVANKVLGRPALGVVSDVVKWATDGRLFMLLVYLPGAFSLGSSLTLNETDERIDFRATGAASATAQVVVERLASAMTGSGYHAVLPLLRRLRPGSSVHYAGTLPMSNIGPGCSIDRGVFLGDSATFPALAAQNHSFTIMANALRVARGALAG